METDELSVNEVQSILESIADYWPEKSSANNKERIKTVVAHHALGDFSATGSEHLVSVMGLESISLEWFGEDFDYMALGHIHKTQKMSTSKNIYYSGSPIPMRFSETQTKNILIYQKKEDTVDITKVEIPSFRPIVQLSTSEHDVIKDIQNKVLELEKDEWQGELQAYWEIKINMKSPNAGLIDSIYDEVRKSNNHLLSLIPKFSEDENVVNESLNINELNINQLFELYYKEKFPTSEVPPRDIILEFNSLLEDINHGDPL
jgi:exonuclease SbcD